MAADLYIFMNDRLHISNASVSLTASATAAGYAIDNVRRDDLMTAWKGNDGTTNDEWLQVDGGSAGWIGSAGQTAFSVIAYDNRGADQDSINLNTDNADSASMSAQATQATWTVSTFKAGITMEWKSWTIQTPAKRYYRLLQPGGARSEAAGTITTKILCWSMFNADGVLRLGMDYPAEGEAPYTIVTQFKNGTATTAGGLRLYNKYAEPGHRFTISFQPARDTLWSTVWRDRLITYGGGTRAFFVQKEGLRNEAQSNFFLCRLTGSEVVASRPLQDQYTIETEWVTEPWL